MAARATTPARSREGFTEAVRRASPSRSSDPVENPGLPAAPPARHRPRPGARSAQDARRVYTLFYLSIVGSIWAVAAYIALPDRAGRPRHRCASTTSPRSRHRPRPARHRHRRRALVQGAHGRTRVRRDPPRARAARDATRAKAVEVFTLGNEESGFGRRKLIRNTLIGALVRLPAARPSCCSATSPRPPTRSTLLNHTHVEEGHAPRARPDRHPDQASDVTLGSVFHVIPEGLNDVEDHLERRPRPPCCSCASSPKTSRLAGPRGLGYDGIVAYSKICTHVGCPVALYEQQTHHLLCPCHQSQFDITHEAEVIFGPAKRPLPQLPITVDAEGYLVAQQRLHRTRRPELLGA